jgi:dipeptidyl aminopeptidase/acylaminoacyl peptidase
MMLGTASDVQGIDGSCTAKTSAAVTAVVTLAVPADMSTLAGYGAGRDEVTNAVGGDPDVDLAAKALGKLVSPIFHASAGDAPHLLVQGKSDDTVAPIQAPAMRDALRRASVPVTLLELDTGHIAGGMLDDRGITSGSCTALSLFAAKLRPNP